MPDVSSYVRRVTAFCLIPGKFFISTPMASTGTSALPNGDQMLTGRSLCKSSEATF